MLWLRRISNDLAIGLLLAMAVVVVFWVALSVNNTGHYPWYEDNLAPYPGVVCQEVPNPPNACTVATPVTP
jgi:hypothetical protein